MACLAAGRIQGGGDTALACSRFQLVLNVAWSWIFFGLHQPGWAFVEIVVLWLAILATTVAFFRCSKVAGWLLVPYLGMGELCQRAQLHHLADEYGMIWGSSEHSDVLYSRIEFQKSVA